MASPYDENWNLDLFEAQHKTSVVAPIDDNAQVKAAVLTDTAIAQRDDKDARRAATAR